MAWQTVPKTAVNHLPMLVAECVEKLRTLYTGQITKLVKYELRGLRFDRVAVKCTLLHFMNLSKM